MKVSVLGAGPAGSTAAYYLASSGIEVELIDRVSFPREKPCAGGLFNPLLYEKEFPFINEFDGKYVYRVQFSCGRYTTRYTSSIPLLKVFLRKEFDQLLLKKAISAGAEFFIGKVPEGDVLIDATGVKHSRAYSKAGICLDNDFETDRDIDTVYIHYGFGGIKGYSWLYPKKGYANIGIGAYIPQKGLKKIYYGYIDFLEKEGIVVLSQRSFRSCFIPFSPLRHFHGKDRLLAGDAAGFVSPSTGEGIFFAMESGKLAAQTLIEGRPFSWYEAQCREKFGRYLKTGTLGRTKKLIMKILEKVVFRGSVDPVFSKMIAENFFRLDEHNLGLQFILSFIRRRPEREIHFRY
ncbi:MAG: FAD-dependent monooxygenase [Spirochaetota bacterium]